VIKSFRKKIIGENTHSKYTRGLTGGLYILKVCNNTIPFLYSLFSFNFQKREKEIKKWKKERHQRRSYCQMIHGLSSFVFFFVFFFVIPFQALWRAAHARHFCVVKCGANWQTQTISPQTRRQVQKVYTHTHTQSVSLSSRLAFTLDFFSLRPASERLSRGRTRMLYRAARCWRL